jgi:hypothetical protein
VQGRIDLDNVTSGVSDDEELVARLQALGVDVNVIDQQLLAQVRSSFGLEVVVRLPDQKPVTFTPKEGATTASIDTSAQILNLERIVFAGAALAFVVLAIIVWRRGGRRRRRRTSRATFDAAPAAARPRRTPAATGPAPAQPPRRPPPRGPAPRSGPSRDAPPRRPPGTNGPPRPPGARPPGPRPPRRPPPRPGNGR